MRVLQQVDAAQEGRLAGAGGAEDGDHVTVVGGERYALEHFEIAVAFVQVADFKRWRGLGHGGSSYCSGALWRWGGLPGDGQPSIALCQAKAGWEPCSGSAREVVASLQLLVAVAKKPRDRAERSGWRAFALFMAFSFLKSIA
ncbi:hypothetical protein D3C81_1852760 [compost metagenome]